MIAKNSCTLPVNKARLDLNKRFVNDPLLVIPWSNMLNGIKSSVSSVMLSRVLNKSNISSTFDLLSQRYTREQMNAIVNRVLKINFMQLKNEQTLATTLQGALFYSALRECKSEVVWDQFLSIWFKIKRFHRSGEVPTSLTSMYRTLIILFSFEVSDNFRVTRATKLALQKLCLDDEISDDIKNRISMYI